MLAGIIISSLCYISPSSYITHFMLGVVYYVTFTHLSYKLLLCLFIIMLWQKLFKICHCCVSYVTIMHPSYIALLGLLISTASQELFRIYTICGSLRKMIVSEPQRNTVLPVFYKKYSEDVYD